MLLLVTPRYATGPHFGASLARVTREDGEGGEGRLARSRP